MTTRRNTTRARVKMAAAAAAAAALLLVTWAGPASAEKQLPSLKAAVEGYYWTRMTYLKDLADLKGHVMPGTARLYESITDTLYFTHHLRIEPRVTFGKIVTGYARIDALENVVWGDNDAKASSPLFAGNPTNTNFLGERIPSVALRHAYLQVNVKLGLLRVGRMPSHWGMGLVSNGGGDLLKDRAGVDDAFGDNHFPSIYDRVLFITDVIAVAKTIAKRKNAAKGQSLYLGYAYDRLVEEPFWPEYGIDFQRPYGEQTFLSRQRNNVEEHVGILLYRWENWARKLPKLKRWGRSDLMAGIYFVYRKQRAVKGIVRVWDEQAMGYLSYDCGVAEDVPLCGSTSDVFIIDPHVKFKLGRLLSVESEAYVITGSTEPRAVPIGDIVNKANIYGWVVRAGSSPLRWLKVEMEGGQASGDQSFSDRTFTQRPMHPDYNVGLIMYEEFLRERSATSLAYGYPSRSDPTKVWAARGLQSNGGVINSFYFMPTVTYAPLDFLKVRLAVLNAWSHKQEGYLFQTGRGRHIGTEVDIGLDLSWGLGEDTLRHMLLRLEGGYMVFGSQVSADYDAPGIFSIQARLAFVL